MFSILATLREAVRRWTAWVGDRDMEQAIRVEITNAGYFGRSAKFHRVKLIAIQRPGWVQIYRFEVTARPASGDLVEGQWLLGLVRDDGRKGSQVRVFRDPSARKALFAEWSEGMICLRGASSLLD